MHVAHFRPPPGQGTGPKLSGPDTFLDSVHFSPRLGSPDVRMVPCTLCAKLSSMHGGEMHCALDGCIIGFKCKYCRYGAVGFGLTVTGSGDDERP